METATLREDLERVVPIRPHPKGPKPRCEHGHPPDRCTSCYIEELEESRHALRSVARRSHSNQTEKAT